MNRVKKCEGGGVEGWREKEGDTEVKKTCNLRISVGVFFLFIFSCRKLK